MPSTETKQPAAPQAEAEISSRPANQNERSNRLRLEYLDGIRGLCAVYVVLCHGDITFGGVAGVPPWAVSLLPSLWFAHYAVAFFIVLSGYCLMLPVVRSGSGVLRGGTEDYIKRRARRILPPYYAALALSLLIDALPFFRKKVGLFGEVMFPAYNPKIILAHLLLIHNLNQQYAFRIDPPMWSVAPEWQIYFVFALLLLPLYRRLGIGPTVLIAFVLGFVPHFFCADGFNFDWTSPWYLGLFAIGMAAATINFSVEPFFERLRANTLAILAPLALLPAVFYIVLARHDWQTTHEYVVDVLMGPIAGAIIVYCTREALRGRRPILVRLLESPLVRWLGLISYSIYLVHFPILSAMNEALYHFRPSAPVRFAVVVFLFVPLCVAAAYLFHLVFERRFMTVPAKK